MLGDAVRRGPGGRDCPCCGPAPGDDRTKERRAQRRKEKQSTVRDIKGWVLDNRDETP